MKRNQLSKHNGQGTAGPEEILYAEEFIIDEGGIDLKMDDESVMSVSFDHVDNFQLAYEVLPEHFTISDPDDAEAWGLLVEEVSKETGVPSDLTDEDIELAARAFLTALARRKGYEKK